MITQAVSAVRHQTRNWRAPYQAAGVPNWILLGFLATGLIAAVCQIVLAVSLVARFVSSGRFSLDATLALVQPWEGYLSWMPVLLVGTLWMFLVAHRSRHETREFEKKFLADNGNTLLARIALEQKKSGLGNEYALPQALCIFAVMSAVLPPLFPDDVPVVMLTLLLVSGVAWTAFLFFCYWLGQIAGKHKHHITKVAPSAMLRRVARKKSIREQFEDLPVYERASMAAQVAKFGSDPNNEVFMRAAVADYNDRLKKAKSDAQSLESLTPAVEPMDEQTARAQRF